MLLTSDHQLTRSNRRKFCSDTWMVYYKEKPQSKGRPTCRLIFSPLKQKGCRKFWL